MTARRLPVPAVDRGLVAVVGVAAPALALLAATSPRLTAYVLLSGVAVFIVFRSLLAGLALFVVLTFPDQLPGALGVGPTLAKPLGVVIVVSWLMVIVGDREHAIPFLPRDAPLLTGALLAFLLWATASLAWTADRHATLQNVGRLVQLVALVFVTYSAVRRQRDLVILVSAFLVGGAVTSAYALGNGTLNYGRLTGSVFNPNSLAAEMAAAMALAGLVLLVARPLWLKALLLVLLALFSVALAQTQSRSGTLALGAAALAALVLAGPLRARVTAMLLIAGALAVGYYFYAAPPQLRERISSIGSGTSEASAGRVDTWHIALRMSGDHPFAGVGLGNFPVEESRYFAGNLNVEDIGPIRQYRLVVHNTYLEFLAELGIVGLALFITVVSLTVGRLVSVLFQRGTAGGITLLLARAIAAASVALLTSQIFISGQYSKQFWLLLGLAIAAAALVAHPAGERIRARRRAARLAGVPAG